jgi:hypothetical protein
VAAASLLGGLFVCEIGRDSNLSPRRHLQIC